jgi:hypothetical protein
VTHPPLDQNQVITALRKQRPTFSQDQLEIIAARVCGRVDTSHGLETARDAMETEIRAYEAGTRGRA